jgi:hypothetical protein
VLPLLKFTLPAHMMAKKLLWRFLSSDAKFYWFFNIKSNWICFVLLDLNTFKYFVSNIYCSFMRYLSIYRSNILTWLKLRLLIKPLWNWLSTLCIIFFLVLIIGTAMMLLAVSVYQIMTMGNLEAIYIRNIQTSNRNWQMCNHLIIKKWNGPSCL